MKVYIETYGCASNQNDSEQMAGILQQQGHAIVGNEKEADIVILNTCTVKQVTENRIRSRIDVLKGKKLILAGCMTATPERLRDMAPDARLISTNRIHEIGSVVDGKKEALGKITAPKVMMPKIRRNPMIDILEIESGCIDSCTFCATKLAKGGTYSYPPALIQRQFTSALQEGCREFWLTGQDVATYRHFGGYRLHDVLNMLCSHEGEYFIRVGMMNPSSVLPVIDETIEAFQHDHVFKFLHLPLQSGSDAILKTMKRRYTVDDYHAVVREFRKKIPWLTVWTDIIVGFPGETEGQFTESMEALLRTKPDFVNVSQYAVRPGTKAAAMRQLPTQVKKERTAALAALCRQLALQGNKRWLGWSGSVMIDEFNASKANWIGRNYCYKPVVVAGERKLGEIVQVTIKDAKETCLISTKADNSILMPLFQGNLELCIRQTQ